MEVVYKQLAEELANKFFSDKDAKIYIHGEDNKGWRSYTEVTEMIDRVLNYYL